MKNEKMVDDLQYVMKSAECILKDLRGEKWAKTARIMAHARFIRMKTEVLISLLRGEGV